jgi:hypothetical protein
VIVRLEPGPGPWGCPLILSCSPAKNELKPGQRQPLPKAAGVKRQALTPGPGLQPIIVNSRHSRFHRRSDVARTFGWGRPLADRSYLVGAVGTAVLTAPAGNAVDEPEFGTRARGYTRRRRSAPERSNVDLAGGKR